MRSAVSQRTTAEFLTRAERSEQLVVLRTDSGQAALLASPSTGPTSARCLARWRVTTPILVICRDAAAAQALVGRLDAWRSGALLRMPVLVR